MCRRKFFVFWAMAVLTVALTFAFACGTVTDSRNDNSSSSGNSSIEKPAEPPAVSVPAEPVTVTIRTETAKITDSGRKSQKMDKLLLSNYFDVKAAYKAGYTKLNVTFTFDVRELDDGYQYVFFYSDTDCKSNGILDKIVDEIYDPEDPSLLYEYRLEHGGSKKNTNWGSHSFSTTIKMNRLKDDLYIRYGASGKYDDDWENKNITVTFEVVR